MKKLSIVLGLAISILTANAALALGGPKICERRLAAMMLRGDNKGNVYTQQIAQNNSNFGSSSDGVHRQK